MCEIHRGVYVVARGFVCVRRLTLWERVVCGRDTQKGGCVGGERVSV